MSRGWRLAIVVAAITAATAALRPGSSAQAPAFVDWPKHYQGQAISRLAAAPEDALLATNFPGSIARFSDGERQIVLRHVTAATRLLHPARDCFRALGYAIRPAPIQFAPDGQPASCFQADGDGRTLLICEQVRDSTGRSFPDISSWYWPALLGGSRGPWLAAMTVERIA